MVKLIAQGASIEGERVSVYTRKQIFHSLVQIGGMTLCKYKCSTHVKSEVIEELIPKRYKIKKTSNLNAGDLLEADVIEVYPQSMLTFEKEANYSHTHGIQTAQSKGFTYAEIAIPFRFLLERAIGR